jgi:hypothetical protein
MSHGQLVPLPAAVFGTVQGCRSGAREDDVGVDRIDDEGTDGELIHGRVQVSPVLTSILAGVDAAVRATVEDPRVLRMHREGAHGAFSREIVADSQPGISAITAQLDALSQSSDTDCGRCRHDLTPSRLPIHDPYASQSLKAWATHTLASSTPYT